METATGENMYLINSNNKHHWCWKLKNRYSHTVVTSKLAILCLVWLGILIGLLLPILAKAAFPIRSNPELLPLGLSVTYLMNPVFGYLGERWTRYYVILSGVLITCCASLLMQFVLILEKFNFWLVWGSFMIGLIGGEIFISNIVQFSITQIGYASSSQQLASFARWWVFTNFLCVGIENTFQFFPPRNFQILKYIVIVVSFFLTVGCLMIGVCFKRKFVIEPPPNIDPMKLVYQVVKYAWKHKCPERRSAFTYGDDYSPSRLDFGKNRYGGPFTTDQVESVKSFRNVLAVLLSSTLFSYYIVVDPAVVESASFNETVITTELRRYTDTNFIIALMIPLLQFVVVPFFPCLIPTILKRIWFGLFLMFVSFLAATICCLFFNGAIFHYIVVGIGVVNNIGSALIMFSSLEFILAQAPCQMQGLLIGVWSIQFGTVSYLFVIAKKTLVMLYCVPTGLLLLSLVVYSIVMYYYKYRLRNEPSDINVRKKVEEVYERNFEREDLANNDKVSHYEVSNQT